MQDFYLNCPIKLQKYFTLLFAGKDATEEFDMLHQPSVLKKFGGDLYVGDLKK